MPDYTVSYLQRIDKTVRASSPEHAIKIAMPSCTFQAQYDGSVLLGVVPGTKRLECMPDPGTPPRGKPPTGPTPGTPTLDHLLSKVA